jgi:cyclophilin family peptidyl-prolyl cis-trans isomerase
MLRRPFLFAVAALAMSSLFAALPAAAANPQVEFDTTAGKIRVELFPDAAPKTVANFLDYVKAKHYDGTQFHRVIAGFMIQGGGFTTDFQQKPTKPPIPIEAEQSSKAGLLNVPGTLAMARTSEPNSATAQFFINVADNKSLNFREPTQQGYGYTVFGKVVSGMDVVDKIAKAPTGAGGPFPKDVPSEPVLIKQAVVVDAPK